MTDEFNHIAPEIIFQNTTTSYKFFWGIALINLHKNKGRTIYECNDVIIRMVCEAYFVLNNNKITLGSADHFRASMYSIKKWYPQESDSVNGLFDLLYRDKYKNHVKKIVSYYKENAPFRFLTPWAPKDEYHPYAFDKVPLSDESIMFPVSAPYVIYKELDQWMIKINPQWIELYGHKHDDLIRVVIGCLSTYIAHRNELNKDKYITYLESVIFSGGTNSVPLVSLGANQPSTQAVKHASAVAKDIVNTPRPILKASSVEKEHKKGKNAILKPSNPSGNVVRNGKLVAIGDESVLANVGPLAVSNKLEAVKFLIEHFSGQQELTMTFKDWALLVDTIQSSYDISAADKDKSSGPSTQNMSVGASPINRPVVTPKTSSKDKSKNKQSNSEWDEVDQAIIGIDLIHDIFGKQEDFPSFVVSSMRLDGSTLSLSIKAWSFKTDKRYLISLLFNDVTYYHASLYLNNEQSYHIACKKNYGNFKYRVGDSNIYINSSKAKVLSIDEI